MRKKSASPAIEKRSELFYSGRDCRAYDYMGAHPFVQDGEQGYLFRVYAPEAANVSVMGEFNGWDREADYMTRDEQGIWEKFIPNIAEYTAYKYSVWAKSGDVFDKSDPYGFHFETRPGNATKAYDIGGYEWGDDSWLQWRKNHLPYSSPVNIYECHLGSWKMHEDGNFYSYRQLADELVPYVKEMGYTHIEFMPLTEYPFDGSWGYQVIGYFAATSRYGTPKDLMYLIDKAHQAGLGVIMDWVPAHFPKDGCGLVEFDGSHLYEYADPLKMEHKEWGTRVFDYGKTSTRNLLFSSAMFWIEKFHMDGLRVDAVASMLYLDYNRQNEWRPNIHGGRENLEAVDFLRLLNEYILTDHPDVMMIAEESTAWPMVTKPGYDGGLGFNFKWNMGWMNDMLCYCSADPFFRKDMHDKITFSFMYAFSENYILPLSHDEVVHGKCSLIGRMPGDWWRQFAGLRTLAFYQMTHPGAKLNFMGNEIGQFIEWRYYESIQWFLTEEYETHKHHQAFIKALNHLYTAEPALYERGYTDDGFTWIDADNSKQSIVSFVRQGEDIDDDLVILINFDPASYESFRVGVPREGDWEVIFDSDRPEFGGSGYAGDEPYTCSSEPYPWNGQMDSIEIKVPGLAGVVLKRRGPSSYKPPVVEEPKAATKKRTSSVKPKPAAAKKAPTKAKARTTKTKAAAKPAAKATAAKKPTAKKAATKAKSASAKSSAKDA